MEESTFSTTLPNCSVPSDVRNEVKPPVQLKSSIRSEIQTSSNDDDDDDDDDDDEDNDIREGDCKECLEDVVRQNNYDKIQPEESVTDL